MYRFYQYRLVYSYFISVLQYLLLSFVLGLKLPQHLTNGNPPSGCCVIAVCLQKCLGHQLIGCRHPQCNILFTTVMNSVMISTILPNSLQALFNLRSVDSFPSFSPLTSYPVMPTALHQSLSCLSWVILGYFMFLHILLWTCAILSPHSTMSLLMKFHLTPLESKVFWKGEGKE